MDPTVTLNELRHELEDLQGIVFAKGDLGHYGFEELEDAVRKVQEHFEALDNWLTNGGFLPGAWSRGENA